MSYQVLILPSINTNFSFTSNLEWCSSIHKSTAESIFSLIFSFLFPSSTITIYRELSVYQVFSLFLLQFLQVIFKFIPIPTIISSFVYLNQFAVFSRSALFILTGIAYTAP